MPSRIEQLCIDKGLKMTGQRRIIARVLSDASDHPDVEQVYRRAAAIDPRISIATVYRTVRLLEEASIITRHDFGDGRARYEEADEHHQGRAPPGRGPPLRRDRPHRTRIAAPRRRPRRLRPDR